LSEDEDGVFYEYSFIYADGLFTNYQEHGAGTYIWNDNYQGRTWTSKPNKPEG
jgi:hypothetical protein